MSFNQNNTVWQGDVNSVQFNTESKPRLSFWVSLGILGSVASIISLWIVAWQMWDIWFFGL